MKLSVLLLFLFLSEPAHARGQNFQASYSDRTPWVEKLREEFQVQIVEDNPEVFDADLLIYLHSFFSASPRRELPIHLHATQKSGSKKVWRRDQTGEAMDLYFASDAGSGLYSKGESAPRALPDGRTEITIDYNSDLYLQLTEVIFPLSDLQRTLLETYHIVTDCSGVTDPCDTFKKHEFLAILGILQDLPSGLRQSLRLNRMIRQPDGVSTLGTLAAVADYSNGVIRVTSRAFTTDGDRMGEGTLVHELAHALWPALPYSIRQNFIDLSWTNDSLTGAIILKSGDHNFVSEYSLSKPEEDFAEHFSAYFNQPEHLKSHAPMKWEWLKSNIFIDTEYYSAAASNAKIYIHARTPDVTAPRFVGDPAKNIEITARVQGRDIEVRIHLKSLVDDVSGFLKADLVFESIEKKGVGEATMNFRVDAGKTRQDRPDEYVLTEVLDRTKLSSKKLYLSTVRLEDRAGNWDYVFLQNKGIGLELEGTATEEELAKNSLFYENERQRKLSREINQNLEPFKSEVKLREGSTQGLYVLHLPKQVDEQKVKLVGVEARFYGIDEFGGFNREEELNYIFRRKDIEGSKTENGLDLPVDLRAGVNIQKMSLYWVILSYRTLTYHIFFYRQKEIVVIEPHSIGSDPTPAEIEINDIGIEIEKPEGAGDKVIIRTHLPMRGFENGGRVRVVYQTPSGKWMIGESQEMRPGVSQGEVKIELGQYREAGEYIIREFQIMENSPEGANPAIQHGSQFKIQKVMSRGVKKTVVIDKPLPPT